LFSGTQQCDKGFYSFLKPNCKVLIFVAEVSEVFFASDKFLHIISKPYSKEYGFFYYSFYAKHPQIVLYGQSSLRTCFVCF